MASRIESSRGPCLVTQSLGDAASCFLGPRRPTLSQRHTAHPCVPSDVRGLLVMFANLFKQTRRRGLQARQPLLRTCVRHITPSGELRGDDAMKALKRSRYECSVSSTQVWQVVSHRYLKWAKTRGVRTTEILRIRRDEEEEEEEGQGAKQGKPNHV